MSKTEDLSAAPTETRTTEPYLPAVALPPRFEWLERTATDLFGRRGFLPVQYRRDR